MQAHMPYAYSLAQRFSYATNYHAITHPSPRPGRPVVGDVRGKGLTAVEQAARVIRAFRQAAATGTSLPDVAADMDAYLIPFMGDEDFATALLVDASHRGRVTFLSCGHPPPMMSGPTEPPSSSPCQPGCRWVWGPAASRSARRRPRPRAAGEHDRAVSRGCRIRVPERARAPRGEDGGQARSRITVSGPSPAFLSRARASGCTPGEPRLRPATGRNVLNSADAA
jgi:hypothetical protein